MFKNTFQSGFLSILYSIGSKPLQIWDKKVNGGTASTFSASLALHANEEVTYNLSVFECCIFLYVECNANDCLRVVWSSRF